MREMEESKNGLWSRRTGIGIITILIFIFIGGTNISTAGFLGIGDTTSWKEEVLLHDGSKIVVERWQKHGGRSEPGQKPGISDQSITFTIPGINKTVKWADEASAELGGRANFELFALHILKTTPYIITSPYLCLSYNKWERPNPPYVVFKYENKEWKRIEMTELPMEFKNINLVINSNSHEKELVSQHLVTTEMIEQFNSSLTQEECKTIVRTPIKIWCAEEIYDGHGSWYGIDWFTSKPSHEACINFCKRKEITSQYCPCDRLFKSKTKEK
ncbi:MAG: hypothetical protein JW976_08715 [Syntrophaceae bacterium]|nr:hypothetical protein [Syntrophaceae bacterium]